MEGLETGCKFQDFQDTQVKDEWDFLWHFLHLYQGHGLCCIQTNMQKWKDNVLIDFNKIIYYFIVCW